ncbi:uncharacterized protein ASCRUDRAFT_114771 [Ascoidea rubescens DSM 1968]|uniref:Transmembrane protein n=1 Tax=Ascoidea rubescens DSM 1968 TaxID=1344418 RepID=A0A1D2VBG0_9ASCO|nr:hypothetical protein ASCRUDRAFT_114771 [Ascoidea rubescens DSM 1968]ODV58940.1 hypothetical protein ASCRUDRAFT_114771 [Ascoidea rubescens DSM 1968]
MIFQNLYINRFILFSLKTQNKLEIFINFRVLMFIYDFFFCFYLYIINSNSSSIIKCQKMHFQL